MKFLRGINCTAVAAPGAPTTGAWVVGDVVCDSVGEYFRCTVAGTPGTWAGMGGTVTLSADREVNAAEPPASNDSRLRTPFTINYCKEPDAETSIVAWAAYADAAGTQPVDGTGGSPTLSIALDGGSLARGAATFRMVKGASNQQGQGVSYPFTIDAADCNKSLTVSLLAFLYNGSYTANAVSIWIYDVTNARLCPVNSNVIERLTAGPAQINMQWSASNSTSYRLCLHVAGTDTTAYGLGFDEVYIGPTYLPSAPAMSDWQDGGAITITATTTNPTKGTTTRDKVWWRRVGDSAEIVYQYRQNTGGASGSGAYLLSLPAGLVADTTQEVITGAIPTGATSQGGCGTFTARRSNSSPLIAVGRAEMYSATQVACVAVADSGDGTTGDEVLGSSEVGSLSGDASWSVSIRIKIAGWSGSTAVQPGSRYLWAQRFAANAVRVTAAPSKLGEYRARRAGVDTAPTTVPSVADGFRLDSGSLAAGRINTYDVYVGPGKVIQPLCVPSAGRSGRGNWSFLVAGSNNYGVAYGYDPTTGVASFNCFVVAAGDSVIYNLDTFAWSAVGYFDLLVADDPVPVALAPAVHVEASSDAGQVCTASTTDLQYEDEVADTHGAWNGSQFTVPVAGVYLFRASADFSSAAGRSVTMYVGGVEHTRSPQSANNADPLQVIIVRKCSAGETLMFRVQVNGGTRTATPANNRLSITRIGDA